MTDPATSPTDGRTARAQRRRHELLELVTDTAISEGFETWSLRAVARSLGVSHGTLLHHFGTKEALTLAVVQRVRARLAAAVDTAGSAGPPDLEAIWSAGTTPDRLRTFGLLLEIASATARGDRRDAAVVAELVDTPTAEIDEFLRSSGLDREAAPAWATLVLAAVRGLQLQLLLTQDRRAVDQAFHLLRSVLDEHRTPPVRTS